jgi:hypothetical protein
MLIASGSPQVDAVNQGPARKAKADVERTLPGLALLTR